MQVFHLSFKLKVVIELGMEPTKEQPSEVLPAKKKSSLQSLIENQSIKRRFEDMLGAKSSAFLSGILVAVNGSESLSECDPMSVIKAAVTAASMDLSVAPSLGLAHLVPYFNKSTGRKEAQFQIGWKGYIQLALRSNQYKTIHLTRVYEGQLVDRNSFTGEMKLKEERASDKVIGFLLYFQLLNGYEKFFYMTREEIEEHSKKYSKNQASKFSKWNEDFEAMALKTVCKMGLSKYGIISIDLQNAIEADSEDKGASNDRARAVDADRQGTDFAEKRELSPNGVSQKPSLERGPQSEMDVGAREAAS